MTPNMLLQIIIFTSATITVLVNGFYMMIERKSLNFKELTNTQELYVGALVYTECFILSYILYNLLFYIYKCVHDSCSDTEVTSPFSMLKTIYMIIGGIIDLSLYYYLFDKKIYIDNTVNNINIIFVINTSFILLITLIINIYKCCKKNNYKSLNAE